MKYVLSIILILTVLITSVSLAENSALDILRDKDFSTEKPEETPAPKNNYFGEIGVPKTKYDMTITLLDFSEPRPGVVAFLVEIYNGTQNTWLLNEYLTDVYVDGYVYKATPSVDSNISEYIKPGRRAKGNVVFEVPQDWKSVEVEFDVGGIMSAYEYLSFSVQKDPIEQL